MRTGLLILSVTFISSFARAGYHRPYVPSPANSGNYDVVYHRLSLTLNPATSKKITAGSVTTYFKTTVSNVTSLQFDLDCTNMTVSSAYYHGAAISFSPNTTTNVLTVTIPAIAITGTLDSVTINWSGTPVTPGSPVPSGYNYGTHNSTQKVIFTLDESFTGHTWWPCKESLYDKIDSVDLIVTAPSTYKVSGNGVVTEVTSGSNTITTWKTRYATATYGINFAIANYSISSSSLNLNGNTINLYNYLFPEDVTNYSSSMNDIKAIIPMYSSVFGVDYPFVKEKYGMTECSGNWGALEVQTMTFMSRGTGTGYNKYVIAHELSHQWFGDMLTTNSWHMIWLNEGFAQYCQSVIYPEHLDVTNLASQRASLKSAVTTTSSVYVNDTSSANSIFAGSDQPYEKGAMFLSMMRTWLGDNKFFNAIKNYLSAPGVRYGFTSVDTLQKYMQAQSTLDMSNFFNDWLYKKGYARYNVQWTAISNGIVMQLQQSPTTAGAGYFDMPVPIEILGPGLDTTVVVIDKRGVLYNSVTGSTNGTNIISFKLSATPTSIKLDPQSLVLATGTTAISSGLYTILPVHSIFLAAHQASGAVNLFWTVNTDEEPAGMSIEKSTDGKNFNALTEVRWAQSHQDTYTGSFTDVMPGPVQYYRLKLSDKDRQILYSNIVEVQRALADGLKVAPNPVSIELRLMVPASFNDGALSVMVQNTAGQVVSGTNYTSVSGNGLSLPVENLKPGLYYLVLLNRKKEKLQAGFIRQ